MPPPSDPIAAATHADPYPYYAELVATRPLYRDDTLGLWVASSAATVTAALTGDVVRVRPVVEPVPRPLQGSAAGEIFGQLVRMTDGVAHMRAKPGVSAKLASLDPAAAATQAATRAQRLVAELDPAARPERLGDFAFRLPVHVVAGLLGVPPDGLPRTASLVDDFVAGLAPTATAQQVEQGKAAAAGLAAQLGAVLGRERIDVIVANTVGYLSQAYEATAGLIGNTLVALARHPEVRRRVATDAGFLRPVVGEVARHDPPVQNTRRFLAADGVVAGQAMKAGETILVVLAAANRDPSVNPHPERFDPERRERRSFTFGLGPHACPGEALATTIAVAGVQQLLDAGVAPEALVERVRYRSAPNTRIPLFRG
jgi:cytochrome P450